jgi:cephalosporin-C deacetylase
VAGASQGGGIAQAVAGLRTGLRRAIIDVPFLTHFRRASGITDAYPYREFADMLSVNRDRVDHVFTILDYFDGLHFAAHGTAPTLYTVCLGNKSALLRAKRAVCVGRESGGPRFALAVSLRWLCDLMA